MKRLAGRTCLRRSVSQAQMQQGEQRGPHLKNKPNTTSAETETRGKEQARAQFVMGSQKNFRKKAKIERKLEKLASLIWINHHICYKAD